MDRDVWVTVMRATRSVCGPGPRPRRPVYSERLIVLLFVWAVLHDRPLCWACSRSSYGRLFRPRRLPSVSQFCRRVSERRFCDLLRVVHERLIGTGALPAMWFFDGKALPVGVHSADRDAQPGYGAGRVLRGYRLHALASDDGCIREFRVTPMRNSEAATSMKMVRAVPRDAVVLADGAYDSRHLYRAIRARGAFLLTRLRGHGRHPKRLSAMGPARREALAAWDSRPGLCGWAMARRSQVERIFAALSCYGGGLAPLPAWVRTLPRVRRWVTAKLIVYHARLARRLVA